MSDGKPNPHPDYAELIAHYSASPAPTQSSYDDGEKILQALFRDGDPIIVKPMRDKGQFSLFNRSAKLTSILRPTDSSVFLLNSPSESVTKAIQELQPVKAGARSSVGLFRNLRFEYDKDFEEQSYDKITQLKFFRDVQLPITVLLDSGNRSLHAIISVDGIDSAEEYALIALSIAARLPGRMDHAAILPNQPIWLPGGIRPKKDDPTQYCFPRLAAIGRTYSKVEMHDWIRSHPIRRPELLSFLDVPKSVLTAIFADGDEHTATSDAEILVAMEKEGIEIARSKHDGWEVRCPYHTDKSPSAWVYRNSGFFKCKGCLETRFLVRRKNNLDEAPKLERWMFEEAAMRGLNSVEELAEDLREEKEYQSYFSVSENAEALLTDKTALSNLGTLFSIVYRIWSEGLKDCLATFLTLRSAGQAAFYGKDEQGSYFVLAYFPYAIRSTEISTFIHRLQGSRLIADGQWVMPVATSEELATYQICSVDGAERCKAPSSEELNRLFRRRPEFWLKHFMPSVTDSIGAGKCNYRNLTGIYNAQAKKLTKDVCDGLASTLDQALAQANLAKIETVKTMLPTLKRGTANLSDLGRVAVSVASLVTLPGVEGNRTSENFGKSGDFYKVLKAEENRRMPIVTNSYADTTGDRRKHLLYILKREKQRKEYPYFCVSAPAGYGKTTFLQRHLPIEFRVLGFKTALLARERVFDVLDGEAQANDWTDPDASFDRPATLEGQRKLLQSELPNRKDLTGPFIFGVSQESDHSDIPDDIDDSFPELTEEQEQAGIEDIERRLAEAADAIANDPRRPAVVYGSVGYRQEICLREDRKPDLEAPLDFCKACPYVTCRAHSEYRKKLPFAEFIITTHEAVIRGRQDLMVYRSEGGMPEPRSAVIFDEKPSGVFTDFKITIKDGSVKEFRDIVAILHPAKTDATKALLANIEECERQLIARHGAALHAVKDAKSCKNVESCVRLATTNPFQGLSTYKLHRSLTRRASNQENREKGNGVQKLADLVESLIDYQGPFLDSVDIMPDPKNTTLTISWGMPNWEYLRSGLNRTLIVMDATAHLDPDYSLPSAPKVVRLTNDQKFPNLTFHCADRIDLSGKKFERNAKDETKNLEMLIARIKVAYPDDKILLVTKKDFHGELEKVFSHHSEVTVDYFGRLKGSNQYRDCKHIILTNFLRWTLESYLLRAWWLKDKDHGTIVSAWPRPVIETERSILKAKGKYSSGEFRDPNLEMLRLQYDLPDMVQTIMRTALRDDVQSNVHVWLPGSNVIRVSMLLDYFVGAKVKKEM